MFETKFSTEITEPKKNEQRTKAKIKSNETYLIGPNAFYDQKTLKKRNIIFDHQSINR